MNLGKTRRSDRITLELPVQVSGTDCMTEAFAEDTRTLVVSRHGAKIVLNRKLGQDQELSVFCKSTGKESAARVVGQIGSSPEGYFYGVEFLDPDADIWGIEFPPLAESEQAVARVLLECAGCRTRDLTYLNEFEAEVFEANRFISRPCKRCTDMGVWKLALAPAPGEPALFPEPGSTAEPAASLPVRSVNERGELRVSLRMTACLRIPGDGEEVILTENVSRGGFAFWSSRIYPVGLVVEVAVPYEHGACNIFTPGHIEHAGERQSEGMCYYGVSYVRVHRGWPGK